MDPKPAQILDPKLKEAYDRVMNTSVQPAKPAEPPPPSQPEQQHAATAPDAPTTPEKHDEPQATITQPPIPQSTPSPATHTPIASSAFVAPHETKKSPVSGKILVVAGVIFLIVYTLFG